VAALLVSGASLCTLGSNMRERIVIALALFVPLVVRANPVIINASSLIAFWVVAFMALMVEAGIVALLLAFSGVTPVACFVVFMILNIGVFVFLFFQRWRGSVPLPILEGGVVLFDGILIRLVAAFGPFQQDHYAPVGWMRALLFSAVGNAASFFVGVVGSGAPWEVKEPWQT
jgi:hypothetical protein